MIERAVNILLVEDDIVDVMNVQRAFARGRIKSPLWVASDGVEALQKLYDGSVPPERRLVLLDLNLPRMNGIEFLHALRADPSLATTPVVVLTTSNERCDELDAFRLNVAGYLVKPVEFADFVELMSALHRYWSLVEIP